MNHKEMVDKWLTKLPPDTRIKWLESPFDGAGPETLWAQDLSKIEYISLPKPTNDFNFAVIMHELGHVFNTEGKQAFEYGKHDELAAWRWVGKEIGQFTPEMVKALKIGMESYTSPNVDSLMVMLGYTYFPRDVVNNLYQELGVE